MMDDLELQALNIQKSIDEAKQNMKEKTKYGLSLSQSISKQVEEDKFTKMQRYDIFISKMEQLQKYELKQKREEKKILRQMQSTFVNSQRPLKDLLFYYNKAAEKGFDSSLVANTLEQINKTLKGRGNVPRTYDDYTTRQFDQSWRMHDLADHIKQGLSKEMYFNHYYLGQASRHLGDIGFKDTEIIAKTFEKLHAVLDEKKTGGIKPKDPLNYEKVVYGNFKNFQPAHYVFDGFESSQEFQQHLTTLLDWQTGQSKGLSVPEAESSASVRDLEMSMAQLISACNQVKDMQIGMEASIDSLRQQYFKLSEAHDKHQFLVDNKSIHYDMLELQELLVRAGYIEPEEAEKFSASQPYEARMERAAKIFYEYCQSYAPEMISPQYDQFYEATKESVDSSKLKAESLSLEEQHDKISLSSLSQSLIGLSQQALSFRREANERDYLHKYYEDRATQGEIKDTEHDHYDISHHWEGNTVKMSRDYLKAWKIFDDQVETMWPRFQKEIVEGKDDLEGQLFSLYGMSACKIEAPKVREEVFKNINRLLEAEHPQAARDSAIIDGLYGIALQSNQSDASRETSKKLLNILDERLQGDIHRINFDQKLNILWAASSLGLEQESTCVKSLFIQLNNLNFSRTHNDLTFEQFNKVRDFHLYLTKASPCKNEPWVKDNINEELDILAQNAEFHRLRYEENSANFDPFKKRVLTGIARGLTMASIDHQMTLENNLVHQNEQEMAFNDDKYPYKPDLMIGFKGQKVLMNVVTSSETMRDVKKPDGKVRFMQRINQLLNSDTEVKTVAVPITAVVNYDIEKLQIKMNQDYNFLKDMVDQMNDGNALSSHSINFDLLGQFGAAFTRDANTYLNSLKSQADKQRAEAILKQLYKLFQIKQQTEKQYEKVIYQQGLDTLKFELMKLSLLHDSLPMHQKKYLNQYVPGSSKKNVNFATMIAKERENIKMRIIPENYSTVQDADLSLSWQGTRLEVELPQTAGLPTKKSIVPEIINQKFMWVDDYFHYEDWEASQKAVFDSFNLLSVPRKDNEFKYFYDRGTHQRIVPQGIFPNPNHKRVLLEPQATLFMKDFNEAAQQGHDTLNQFEKDPFKMMVMKEQNRSSTLAPITPDLSFITNLNNIKQGLKQDYSDKEILDVILVNSSFTDRLIEEHLRATSREDKAVKFAPRDAGKYRDFVRSTYFSKDQADPFSHFYTKESGKVERVFKVENEAKEKYEEAMANAKSVGTKEKIQEKILKSFSQKVEDMLLQNQRENEDILSLSHQFASEVKVNYDLKTLMRSETISDIDPEVDAGEITDVLFLFNQRKRAETKLIKSKIIYKQDQGMPLSKNEKRYLEKWVKDIQSNQNLNLLNVRDSMLPKNYSKLTLGEAMSAEDIFTFNQIPNVEIDRSAHGQYSINDLVLELSHFIDEEVVNRVEVQMMSDRIKDEWSLPKSFQLIESRNKEIGMLLNELEEFAWRSSGILDSQDMETLKQMFSINRNKNSFDREYFDIDMQSMESFIGMTSPYDDRIKLLEEWCVRKEEEIKSRVVLPPKSMKREDSEIFEEVDTKLKAAREKIVSQFLETPSKSSNNVPKRDYKDLTTNELHKITESIAVRLNLFGGDYPAFMPQAVKAVMEHPNLAKTDRSKLDTFSQMFELDWRGDKTLDNKKEFLSSNPIYFNRSMNSNLCGYSGPVQITSLIRNACQDYVETLTESLVKEATQKTKVDKKDE